MPRSEEGSAASAGAARGTPPSSVTVAAVADQPSPAARWSASANGRPVRKTAAIGNSSGVRLRRYSARSAVFSDVRLVAASRSASSLQRRMDRWYTVPRMAQRSWFPTMLEGSKVILRRHVPENVAAFRRWYADPQIARLARYQATPMRPEEIERFFAARVIGPDALAMAVHVRGTDRLIGTCAFSQLDGENGSALYHITIGEPDTWGKGYGTEATRLMVDHAFETLGLHRISLNVFEFNERAIRA